jgi:hypothetical protein
MVKKSKLTPTPTHHCPVEIQYKVYPFVSFAVTFSRRPFWKTAFEILKSGIT